MESTLVFPIVLLTTIMLLFTALWMYRSAFLHSTAAIEAQRASFVWDDSGKDPVTGKRIPHLGDGLYWRITGDLFSAGLGLFGTGGAKVTVPSQVPPSSMMEQKLARTSKLLPQGLRGGVSFVSSGWMRKVSVQLEDTFIMPIGGVRIADGNASSYVTEPTEWIRLIDLTRTYFSEIKDRISPRQAASLFHEPGKDSQEESIRITSEREAAAYLRKLVSGIEREFVTPSGQKRLVDALDGNGIAHQAFFTYSESQLRFEQLPKDLELLQERNAVKGVVWHFFKGGKYEPSANYKAELERKGIIVVIHQ
jgi:hypothetical protein